MLGSCVTRVIHVRDCSLGPPLTAKAFAGPWSSSSSLGMYQGPPVTKSAGLFLPECFCHPVVFFDYGDVMMTGEIGS